MLGPAPGAVLGTKSPAVNKIGKELALLSCSQLELGKFASSLEEGHSRQRERHVQSPGNVTVCMGVRACLAFCQNLVAGDSRGRGLPFGNDERNNRL